MRHSGHIQNTFRTHSYYIQGALMKHSNFTLLGLINIDGQDNPQNGQDCEQKVTRMVRIVNRRVLEWSK